MVAAYLIPVLQLVGKALRGGLQAAVCFGRREFRYELRPQQWGRQESREQRKY
jgi:glutamate-1-semialdehyde aminotransferase